jgi:hypothetical protein
MTDSINKIYDVSSVKKINHSCPIIRVSDKSITYTSSEGITTNLNKINTLSKSYKINVNKDHHEDGAVHISDDINKSDDSLILNNKYDEYKDYNKHEIIYNDNDDLYNLFHFHINCNNINCVGFIKDIDTSYDLVLEKYKGIHIHCQIECQFHGHRFIFFSKHIKKNKTIYLHNDNPFYYGLSDDQIEYYPIYIICCDDKYKTKDFIELYPYLIKNIIKYEL